MTKADSFFGQLARALARNTPVRSPSEVHELRGQVAATRAELARWQAALDTARTRHHGAPTEAGVNAVCDEIERLATEPPR